MIEFFVTAISLEAFDQQKLEGLLRKIPSAYERTEENAGVKRKFYLYPKTATSGYQIECQADYYLNSTLPSLSRCDLRVYGELNQKKEEHQIEFTDETLFNSISYGDLIKKFSSTERVYAYGLNGRYGEIFRYNFSCTKQKCQLTFTTRPADK